MENPDFAIEVNEGVLRLAGELDLVTSPGLRDQLLATIELGHRLITLDLGALTFLDSTGLGVMVAGLKRARDEGGDIVLRDVPPRAMRVLKITGLDKVFTILPRVTARMREGSEIVRPWLVKVTCRGLADEVEQALATGGLGYLAAVVRYAGPGQIEVVGTVVEESETTAARYMVTALSRDLDRQVALVSVEPVGEEL